MSSYTDPILTKQGYRSLGTNSDFFMNLSVDTPTKGNLLMFDGLNWKPTATEDITFGTLIFDGGNASGLGHAYLSVI